MERKQRKMTTCSGRRNQRCASRPVPDLDPRPLMREQYSDSSLFARQVGWVHDVEFPASVPYLLAFVCSSVKVNGMTIVRRN